MRQERPSWDLALQDGERRLGWAKCWNDQHAMHVKFRKVSNGERSQQTQHLL
jgi:hypothetical protein